VCATPSERPQSLLSAVVNGCGLVGKIKAGPLDVRDTQPGPVSPGRPTDDVMMCL
ncbi:Uncharacterized protein DAT39_017272, partial [Clarias magur]